jgi:hypothetical protein
MQAKIKPKKSWRLFWQITGVMLLILVVAGTCVVRRIRQLPPELMQDIRAGIAARDITDPNQRFEKFLEGRYGSQNDPVNQRNAFLGFFNPDHIRAMQLLVKHSPKNQRQANINAAAKWVQQYRENLTPQQRADLRSRILSPEGLSTLKQATALYNSQDVYYRDQSQPVVSQLLTTIASLQSHP